MFKCNKKSILTAFAASFACAGAYAQSSVSLYGVIDVGIDFNNNSGGHQLWHMQDGTYDGIYGSRWGLQGTEDLGGGLKAVFKLENGFNVINGTLAQGGREFGRQAYVGLSSDQLGTVTAGRQYESVVDFYQPVTMDGAWGGAWHAGDVDNSANSFRVDNSLKYMSPNIHGLTFGGLIGMTNSNSPGTSKIGLYSVGASYSGADLTVGAAYLHVKQPGTLLSGNYVPNTTGAAVGATGAFSYVGQPANEQIMAVGATYKLGAASIGINYSNVLFGQANGTNATVRFATYEAFGSYQFTPALSAGLGYSFTDGSIGYSSAKPKYHQIASTVEYTLTKRTFVYAMATYQIAAGAGQPADIFDGVTGTASSSNHQLATRVGIVHKF
ncbi:porin [Paraburkholderia lycopersici]|uniref:Outer membrane protein (Porin) n=1 Tax=Paraburkholderia lycopersici TaxID=416944 RepID=A0A1G6TGW3_9BURK|nr:Outer membrane protein (porin) [Paraburkholderia lycopersici]